jgi:hypothetical protein
MGHRRHIPTWAPGTTHPLAVSQHLGVDLGSRAHSSGGRGRNRREASVRDGGADGARILVSDPGVHGPFRWGDSSEMGAIAEQIRRESQKVPGLSDHPRGREYWAGLGRCYAWYKSLHIHVEIARAIALRHVVVREVAALIGPELALWGAQLVEKEPGESHRWHADIECLDTEGVTVWMPLRHSSQRSGLKVIEHSCWLAQYPQELRALGGLDLGDDDAVLAAAQSMDASLRISCPIVAPGHFLVFRGRTWHRSFNNATERREALILQYSPARAKVRIPTTFHPPVQWHPMAPPIVCVSAAVEVGRVKLPK